MPRFAAKLDQQDDLLKRGQCEDNNPKAEEKKNRESDLILVLFLSRMKRFCGWILFKER